MTTTTTEQKDEAAQVAVWAAKLEEAEEKSKTWRKDTEASFREYLGGKTLSNAGTRDQTKAGSKYPVWWTSIKTIQPALYSRTPVPVANVMLGDSQDPVARVAATLAERLAKNLIHACPFDRVNIYMRDMFIHSGKTTNRICFKSTFKKEAQQQIDPATQMSSIVEVDVLDKADILLEPLHFKDYLHTPNARWEEEIDWKAYKSLMTKDDAMERFGEEIAKELSYTYSTNLEEDSKDNAKKTEQYSCVWEIWNKRDKKVYWYSKESKGKFLDVKDDPYQLVGFFPSPPFMLGTCSPDDLFPVPDYIQLQPLINQLHGMFSRYRSIVRAARRRGIFDENVPELKALAETADESEFIGVKNFADLVGDRGIDKLIAWFPTGELSKAITELAQVITDFEQRFYEIAGVPDILRGLTDPRETAASVQAKGKFTSLRFSAVQREFQRLIRDTIEMMCDLALKVLPDDKLASLMGISSLPQADQAVVPQAVEMLRNDKQRQLRIDIETDSMVHMDRVAEVEERNYLAKTLFDGLNAMNNLGEKTPMLLPVVAKTIMHVISGLKNGKSIEGELGKVFEQMMQPPPPLPPPPPDPQILRYQAEAQIKQLSLQQQGQVDQAKLTLEQQRIQLESMQMEADNTFRGQELQLKAQELASKTEAESAKLMLASMEQKFSQQMQGLEQQLNQFQVISSEKEKRDTENRLLAEDRRAEQAHMMEQLQTKGSEQPIHFHLPQQSKSKRATITRNPLTGEATITSEETE